MAQITINAHSADEYRAAAAYFATLAKLAEARPAVVEQLVGIGIDAPDVGVLPAIPAVDAGAVALQAKQDAEASAAFAPQLGVAPAVPLPPASVASAPPTVPVPPAPASVPPAGAGSVNVAGKPLDSRGIPHSSRIHATPPTITQKGVWRAKRGLNDEGLVKRIEAELLAAQGVPAPAAASVPQPPVTVVVPQAPSAPTGVPVLPVAAAPIVAPQSLAELMQMAAPRLAAQSLTMPQVIEACKAVGLDSLAGLQSRPDLAPAVWAALPAA